MTTRQARESNGNGASRLANATGFRRALAWAALCSALLIGTLAYADGSTADRFCLACHSMAGLEKTLGNGDKLPLHIAKSEYSESVHAKVGCKSCHGEIDPARHPAMNSIASARNYSLEKSTVCRTCHAAKFAQYEGSIHASLVAQGNDNAPLCIDCHNVHAQQPVASLELVSGEPCKGCHGEIFDAYAGSMHGQARIGEGHLNAPICADCHQVHDVQAVAASDRVKTACLGCHGSAPLAHKKWLPNAGLHLEAVSCPACHSPLAERAIDLRLYDKDLHVLVTESFGKQEFETLARAIDTAGDGLDPLELWQLVRETEKQDAAADVTLNGRLEVRSGVEAHRLALKTEAVRDCATCHENGAEPYQQVTISVAAEDGRRIRYKAEKETLTSAVSVDAIGGFYTAGGTRIRLLDGLLILAISAGLAIPVTHMSIRKYFKNKR